MASRPVAGDAATDVDDAAGAVEGPLEASATALIARVGKRVHAARKSRRFSRRELSERSGVSPRYLAQLEGGDGNISIGLLQRIAIALERPIESLVGAPGGSGDTSHDDATRLLARYRSADAATRARVLRALDPEGVRARKAGRLCLVGLRGAGKSTLGARLGEAMNVPFVELNQEIERGAGIPVGETIALYGEEGYRQLEADTLQDIVATRERVVLAVAGGVVERPDTFAELLGRFHTVWLQATPEEHMARVRAQGDLRPMAGNPRAMARLREILAARESRYRQAEHHLDTGDRNVEVSLSELRALVASHDIFGSDTSVDAHVDTRADNHADVPLDRPSGASR